MTGDVVFRSARLSGRAPLPGALELYRQLFGTDGDARLQRDQLDWRRHNVAPWTLYHAGHAVGVGGFRIGFGDAGLEFFIHFLPDVWGQGLASEFAQAALDHAGSTLREDTFFAHVEPDNHAPIRILERVGFVDAGMDGKLRLLRLTLPRTQGDRPPP